MRRAAALLAVLAVAGCVDEPPPPPPRSFAPLAFDYLTKLRLNVTTVTIDDGWAPRTDGTEHVEYLAPTPPVQALRQMATERLVAGGPPGEAVFTIEDASLTRAPGQLVGSFAVRLSVRSGTPETGTRTAETRASVSGTRTLADTPDGDRAVAYELTRKLMDDMNVEFEYQVRHTLKGDMGGDAATPAAVQTQDLGPPGK